MEEIDDFEYEEKYIEMHVDEMKSVKDAWKNYLKMAKMYLTDPDYPGKADERAYKNAIKRIEYYEKY